MKRSPLLLALLVAAVTARGQTMNLDMGAPGTIATDISMPFSALDGTPVDGRTLNLTVQLPAAAPLSLYSANVTGYFMFIILQTNAASFPGGSTSGSAYLIDASGAAISTARASGGGSASNGQLFAYLGFIGSQLADVVNYHWGASYSFTLPNDPGLMITSASFRVVSSGGPFIIGPHGAIPVPESGPTILLLLLAIAPAITMRTRHWPGAFRSAR